MGKKRSRCKKGERERVENESRNFDDLLKNPFEVSMKMFHWN